MSENQRGCGEAPGTDTDDASTSGRVSVGRILSIALPSLGVLAATPIYLLCDTAVVGRLGKTDLAALAAATTILAQITTQLTFLSYGTTARAGRFFGAGRRDKSVEEGLQSTWIAVIVGIALAWGMWLWAPVLTAWLAASTDVAREATRWLRIASPAVPLTLVTMAGNGWLRAVQNARYPLYFTLAGVGPALVLVPILVSRCGISGSAVANVTGETITACCFLVCLIRENARYANRWRPEWSVMKTQLVMGRDLIARSLSFQLSFISAAAVAGRCGAASLAAHQVLLQLWNFLTMVLDSLAIAAQAFVGAALGAGRPVTAKAMGCAIIRWSGLLSLVLAAAMSAGYFWVPRLFTQSESVLDAMAGPWWQLVVLVLLGGCVFALDGILLGAGDAVFLRNVTLVSAVVGFLPLTWISLSQGWGLVGVWWGLIVFFVLRLATTALRFIRGGWVRVGVQ
ncbi:MATE family efflux transporter [Corynebacterium kroppenstedtii]|uniref:MATE family efflux transporter n=1 Tax=Corynebacterium sp. PCR 32 TaxID=3351342 RepID=UPI0030AA5E72